VTITSHYLVIELFILHTRVNCCGYIRQSSTVVRQLWLIQLFLHLIRLCMLRWDEHCLSVNMSSSVITTLLIAVSVIAVTFALKIKSLVQLHLLTWLLKNDILSLSRYARGCYWFLHQCHHCDIIICDDLVVVHPHPQPLSSPRLLSTVLNCPWALWFRDSLSFNIFVFTFIFAITFTSVQKFHSYSFVMLIHSVNYHSGRRHVKYCGHDIQ